MGSRSGKFRENPEMREPSAIGKAIYYFRTDRQLTQDDVANDGGISKQRISEIETGAVQDPHPDTLNKIAIGLSITVDELLKKADEYAKESGNRGAKTRAEYDAWERSNQSLFRPLERGSGDRKIIERFLDHAENDQIVRNEAVEAQSNAILDTSRFVMLAGRAGTGKTMTALDLARRRETGKNRVFVATGWQTEGEDGFVEGAIQRSHRSSTIIIDDAHHDFVKADRVLNRTLYATHGRPITFILTARVNTKHELTDDLAAEGLLTHTALNGQYIWLEPSDAFFRAIIEKARPDLRLITNAQLKRLVTMSACDMMLFRQILDSTQALDDLNELSLHDVTRQFLRRYFDTEKVYAPNLLRLAMLGQFEVPVRIERFSLRPLEPMYPRALSALTIETGRPLTYQFIHSSLAELAFSALLWAHGFDEPSQTAVPEIVAFLDESQPDDRRLGVIEQILKGRLQLIDGSLLKLSLLSDQKLIMWITSNDGNNLGVLSLATELTKGTACNSLYRVALVSRLKSIWRNKYILGSQKFIRGICRGMLALKRVDPSTLPGVQSEWRVDLLILGMEKAERTLPELVKILEYSTAEFAASLIEALTPEFTAKLIDRTIQQGASIGTIALSSRELAQRVLPGGSTQLAALEARIGADAMLQLIDKAEGTLPELVKILGGGTAEFAASLIEALTPEFTTKLIDRTIQQGASIGTIDLSLRDLAQRELPGGTTQLVALEARIGADAMLRLIDKAEGTLPELVRILGRSTAAFAASLIEALTPEFTTKLIDRTIQQGASIGTIHLSLRDLAQRELPEGGTELAALEARIGVDATLRLLDKAEGTLPELVSILEYSTAEFAASLIEALTPEFTTKLIDRTIQQEASIGTINLALRVLGKRKMPGGKTQLGALNAYITANDWWRLLAARADCKHATYLLRAFPQHERNRILLCSVADDTEKWRAGVSRSSLDGVALFITEVLVTAPKEVSLAVGAIIVTELNDVCLRSKWAEIGRAIGITERSQPFPLLAKLRDSALQKLSSIDLINIRFDTIQEALSCLVLFKRHLRNQYPSLLRTIWELVPNEKQWLKDKNLLSYIYLLPELFIHQEAKFDDARRAFFSAMSWLGDKRLQKCATHSLFLLLWNLYALKVEHAIEPNRSFEDVLGIPVWRNLVALLKKKLNKRVSWEERLQDLCLAGVVALLAPSQADAMRSACGDNIRDRSMLLEYCQEADFVSAYFALRLLAFTTRKEIALFMSKDKRQLLSLKARIYPAYGKAIEQLIRDLR